MSHQQLIHAAARTAHNGILFHRHQHIVIGGKLQNKRIIERFDKTHIDQRGVELVRHLRRFRQQSAEVEYRHFFARAFHHAFADRQ